MRRRGPAACAAAGALAVLLLPAPALAAAGTAGACAGLGPPPALRVEVAVDRGGAGAPVVEAVPAPTLARRAAEAGRRAGPGRVLGGLTTATVQGDVGYTLAKLARSDGTACVALRAVEARLAARGVRVLLDARYPEGSCERRAILGHERQHVRIAAAAVADGAPALRRRLRAAAARWAGRWLPAGSGPEAAVGAALRAALADAVAEARDAADRRQAAIDTERSYARVRAACDGW